jgi:hypothetical protein
MYCTIRTLTRINTVGAVDTDCALMGSAACAHTVLFGVACLIGVQLAGQCEYCGAGGGVKISSIVSGSLEWRENHSWELGMNAL